jgi:hypothetical protein
VDAFRLVVDAFGAFDELAGAVFRVGVLEEFDPFALLVALVVGGAGVG